MRGRLDSRPLIVYVCSLHDSDAADGVVLGIVSDLYLGGDTFLEQFHVTDDAHALAADVVETVERLHHVI